MATLSQLFSSLNKINSLGEGIRACNDVLAVAKPIYQNHLPVPFPNTFNTAYVAVVEYLAELNARANEGYPYDSMIDFRDGIVTRLWIEMEGVKGANERLASISLYEELATSASVVVPEILPGVAGIVGRTLSELLAAAWPVIITVAVVITGAYILKKRGAI